MLSKGIRAEGKRIAKVVFHVEKLVLQIKLSLRWWQTTGSRHKIYDILQVITFLILMSQRN